MFFLTSPFLCAINLHSTGEADRTPSKVGVAVTDIMTGLYAHGAIMAGLRSVNQTGEGVWIDCNLFETQVSTLLTLFKYFTQVVQLAGLANIASNYLIAGQEASRHGTAHPSIVPYQVFPCQDSFLMIGAGNDKQVASFISVHLNRVTELISHSSGFSLPRSSRSPSLQMTIAFRQTRLV